MRALLATPLWVIACTSATVPPPAGAPVAVASSTASSALASPKPSSSASAAKPMPTLLLPGVGMSSSPSPKPPPEEDVASGPGPGCAKDEDCWSKTCCPAKAPEECVHASRARNCAVVDVSCKPSPIHYTCICESGSCQGRLAPP